MIDGYRVNRTIMDVSLIWSFPFTIAGLVGMITGTEALAFVGVLTSIMLLWIVLNAWLWSMTYDPS